MNMPLVPIALIKSNATDRGKKIGGAVYLQTVATLNVPPNDNFQIITEHDPNSLIYRSPAPTPSSSPRSPSTKAAPPT
jgi:hypothetical protein